MTKSTNKRNYPISTFCTCKDGCQCDTANLYHEAAFAVLGDFVRFNATEEHGLYVIILVADSRGGIWELRSYEGSWTIDVIDHYIGREALRFIDSEAERYMLKDTKDNELRYCPLSAELEARVIKRILEVFNYIGVSAVLKTFNTNLSGWTVNWARTKVIESLE